MTRHAHFIPALLVGLLACDVEPDTEQRDVQRSSLRFMYGLGEFVDLRLENDAHGVYKSVIRADGTRQTYGSLLKEEREQYLRRYGTLSQDLVATLHHQDLEGETLVLILPRTSADTEQVIALLEGLNVKAKALNGVAGLVARLSSMQMLEVARSPRTKLVRRAVDGGATGGEYQSSGGPEDGDPGNSLTVPLIDSEANPTYTGEGQRIGIVEDGDRQLVRVEHADMVALSIVEEGSVSACPGLCPSGDICMTESGTFASWCVDQHASRVLSAAAHVVEENGFGAFAATFYHPNQGDGSPDYNTRCDTDGSWNAYSWLASNAVTTVIESYGCPTAPAAADGWVQDVYTRYTDMSIFRAAGFASSEEDTTDLGCAPANSICVGGMRPASGGGYEHDPVSPHVNPATANSDREEPDIVALSEDVFTIGVQNAGTSGYDPGYDSWTISNGTSFSSPPMGALAALFKEKCDGVPHLMVRAAMMTSAWSINPEGVSYSIPGSGDYRDGAGAPTADNLLRFCGSGGPDDGTTTSTIGGVIDNTGSGHPETPEWISGVYTSSSDPNQLELLGTHSGSGKDYYKELQRIEAVEGGRFRATLSWDTCPGTTAATPTPLATDLDLLLCNFDEETCIAASMSFDNNNEGFEVVFPGGGGEFPAELGTYTLIAKWDSDASQVCENPFDAESGYSSDPTTLEPFYAATAWAPDGTF